VGRFSDDIVPVFAEWKGVQIMQFLRKLCIVTIVLAVLGPGGLSHGVEGDKKSPKTDKPQETVHTVDAAIDFPSSPTSVYVQAEKRPGSFTIPKDSRGTKLKYSFINPKTGYTSNKLRGSNIFSVTEHRYMDELDKNPDFELPPGDYKFVVGGDPGASGTLGYTLIAGSGVQLPPGTKSPNSPTRKPPPTDTSKTGTEREPLHPGGEGKRKVVVDYFENRVKLDAWLKIGRAHV
jgi:hypothetical protein